MNRFTISATLLSGIILLLGGCGSFSYHRVEKGETLYSIGWRYGQDYRELADWNELRPPYTIYSGQLLRVTPPAGYDAGNRDTVTELPATASAHRAPVINAPFVSSTVPAEEPKTVQVPKPQSSPKPVPKAPPQQQDKAAPTAIRKVEPVNNTHQPLRWKWPATGKLANRFSGRPLGNKGIDIAGRLNEPVYASAGGRVVYSGSGLINYGKLIIIKHNDSFLSAYGYNNRLLVSEGEEVHAGQHIADMGSRNRSAALLHFEIRRNGKPVDPQRYLPPL